MKSDTLQQTCLVRDSEGAYRHIPREELVKAAQECIKEGFTKGEALTSPAAARNAIQVLIGGYEHEVFFALWLNTRHEVIGHAELFRGTIDGASVYPREVVKEGLARNAAAVIFAHNHPSGNPEPSRDDMAITERLKSALALVDIRVLDHLVIGATSVSFAERGLL